MSVIIQSSGGSIRTATSPNSARVPIEIPPAVTAGDILCIAYASACTEEMAVHPDEDLEVEFTTAASESTEAGRTAFFYVSVPTSEMAGRLRAQSVVVGPEGDCGSATAVSAFRVTGADVGRFVESTAVVEGDLAAEGELTVPSFDPEYRRDNMLLFISSATFQVDATAPVITVAGSTPVEVLTAPAGIGDEASRGLTTALSVRSLSTSDPTGVTRIAYSSQPASGMGMALMLRSANRPPVINLAAEWAAEVGREAVISATITDPDQTPVSYVWSQIDGPETVTIGNVYARAFTFTPGTPGIYRFTLRATDVDGGRSELTTSVIVPTGTTGPADIVTQDGWVDQDGGTVDAVELADGSDATFARTEDLPVGDPMTVRLNPIYGGAAVTLTVRGAASNPSPAIQRTLTLRQSDGTLIAERSYPLPTVMGSYVFRTTRNETALITNRSAMTLTIVDEVA